MSGQENGARGSEQSTGCGDGDCKAEPPPFRNYFITGRDVCVVKIKQLIETMRPTAPEELGSTSLIERMGETVTICCAICADPRRYIDHLIKHEKHKVLIHEVVMITHWFEEILPHLSGINHFQPDATSTFTGSAPAAFVLYRITCCEAVNTVLGHWNGAESLGTAILDVIDVSLLALREFTARDDESSPWTACSWPNPLIFELLQEYADDVEGFQDYPMMYRILNGKFASCGLRNLMKLVSLLETLPQYVLTKLIHPDTRFIPTLLDLIEHKPWEAVIKQHLEATPTKSASENEDHGFRPWVINIHSMESKAMELLSKYSGVIYKTFPRDVAVAHLMPREYSGQLLALMDKCGDESLDEARKQLEAILTSTECSEPELNWTTPEPSPYHVNVRADLAVKKKAIIAIHGAMGSFETTLENKLNRVERDFGFILKLMDMDFCSKCKKPETRLRCSRCQVDYYCKRKCQSKHWATHKLTCEEPKVRREREEQQLRSPTVTPSAVSEFAREYFSILF